MGYLLYGIAIPLFFIPAMIHSYYTYYVQNGGKDSFVLSIPLTLPFDRKTPIGYFLASAYAMIQYNIHNSIHFVDCFVLFGLCMLLTAFAGDFKHSLEMFDKSIDNLMNDKKLSAIEARTELKHELNVILKFHTDLNQLSRINSNLPKKLSLTNSIYFFNFSISSKRLTQYIAKAYRGLLIVGFYVASFLWCIILLGFHVVSGEFTVQIYRMNYLPLVVMTDRS